MRRGGKRDGERLRHTLDREEVLKNGLAGPTRMRRTILEGTMPIYNETVKVSYESDITTEQANYQSARSTV